ncbi:hypothetical protein O3M35_008975 [Rhynocoris fuscipes]|uniref:Laccase n=1 Tax=Rhynocoris fuscipes TaxID=488301 RepID=A0AAW1D4V9_9HEMI
MEKITKITIRVFLYLVFFQKAANADYLKVNDYDSPYDGANHPCYRECDGLRMICEYNFTIRSVTSMNRMDCGSCPLVAEDCLRPGCITAGGLVRSVVAVNQKIPGPAIFVCEYDRIIVNVNNELRTKTLSIHWHGIHQTGSLFMDGVPFVSQIPVQPFGTFKYNFIAEPHGTQLWHSHSGFQESDGLYGMLIVRREEPSHIRELYDFDLPEHTAIIWHWYHQPTADILEAVLHQNGSIYGFGFLINGKGALKEYIHPNGSKAYTPRERFRVSKGNRYRFRIIYNSAIYCPLQISVDNHKLIMFASDTSTFEPIEVDSFMISAGERYDFVLNANETERCYWMRIRALGDCGEKKNKLHDGALICYDNETETDANSKLEYFQAKRSGLLLNPAEELTQIYDQNELIHLTDLNSTESEEFDYSREPNLTFYFEINSRPIEQLRYPGPWHQINYFSFLFPGPSFLENQMKTEGDDFCNETHIDQCKEEFCSCTYVKKIPKDSLVEIVLFDTSKNRDQDHPVHLHGHKFYVVSEGSFDNMTLENVKYKNENAILKKKLKNAPSKDTVSIPNDGFIILRLNANNIGLWVFHCHVTNHMELGMALLLQVGTTEEILSLCSKTDHCNVWLNKNGCTVNRLNNVILFTLLFILINQLNVF